MGRSKVNRYYVPKATGQRERIKEMLKLLELNEASNAFDYICRRTAEEDGTHLDFAERLLGVETNGREEKRLERWIKLAKFPFKTRIKDYDFSAPKLSINQTQIHELATCKFIENGQNVIFLGPPGVGKTHLAVALGLDAIEKGKEVKFFHHKSLLEKVEKAEGAMVTYLLRSLVRADLVILDDIGFYSPGKNGNEFLYKLVEQRQGLSTIFISNHDPSKWGVLFGPMRTSAALDRILAGDFVTVSIDGISYRPGHEIRRPEN